LRTSNPSLNNKVLDSSGSNIVIHRILLKKGKEDRIVDPLAMDSYNRSGENFGMQKFEYFNEQAVNRIKNSFSIFTFGKKKENKLKSNYFANNIKMKLIKGLDKHKSW
jgi:hypothetical protein